NLSESYTPVTEEEIYKAVKSLNKGKAADIFGITAEHLLHATDELIPVLVVLMNSIFSNGTVPDCMKLGVLTPVYKKKGSSQDAKNYRGITVTPAISKLFECIIKDRIQPKIEMTQNNLQRGFTAKSSPLNCSLILEEYIRESKDLKKDAFIAYLDAKSAFDVVSHASLMRKLFHIGVDGVLWKLIYSLHTDAKSMVRWGSLLSEKFDIQQGVRQGGVLSTDLYKVYVNPALDRLCRTSLGGRIGEIDCTVPTTADDMTILSDDPRVLQSLVAEVEDYSSMEQYLLQPAKSVVMHIKGGRKRSKVTSTDNIWTIYDEKMPVVEETTHMGILRSSSSEEVSVTENMKKARRTLYSLMASGLHGRNGLDPETSIQLYQTYVIPVLLYGLEILLPNVKCTDMLEKMNKKFLKQILSLSTTTADPAVYILSGTIPVEGLIHKRALSFFGNICRLQWDSV
ncbi:MAG: reverse transcriptase family protein, partial [Candidatus Thiodiazotropha sp.]